jgi:hypothetical protein
VSEPSRGRLPWGRIVAEALLIFGSVYLAIFLEGRADDRRETREAHQALGQLLSELRGDQADLVEVRAAQDSLTTHYEAILRWLGDITTLPGDSMTASLDYISNNNRTMFPRHAAWTTMVAAGQLADLDDPELVTLLGNLYENVMPRIEYNGAYYDSQVNDTFVIHVTEAWDSSRRRFGPGGEAAVIRLRESMYRLWIAWNLYYLDLLADYGELVDGAAAAVEEHLAEHGIETA